MSEWNQYELGELLQEKGYIRGPFGSALKRDEMVPTGIPVYEQKNAIYNSREFRFFVGEEKFNELKRFQVKTNDLIISCSGTVGKISIIEEEDPKGIISQALLILRPDTAKVLLKYLFYFLSSRQGFELITQASHGSVQINIAERKVVEAIPLLLPDVSEQKAIAEILSSLDDKIDLLHRQNKTLESLAQTLFRQWFIEESDDSWEPGTLSDVSTNVRKSVSVAGITDEVKYVALEHIEKRHIALYSCGEGKTVASNKSEFQRNDILFGKLRPYFHKVCFAPFSGICSTDILVIRPKEEIFFPYCLFAYFQDEVVDYSDLASEGTRMPRTNWEILGNYPITIPDRETLIRFNRIASPMIEKIDKNIIQIASLTKVRDAILPKLMSGEVALDN